MGYFFVDDRVHDDAGFIIVACVYCHKDPSNIIASILQRHGLDPEIDEFKSRINFRSNPKMASVRGDLKDFLFPNCRFGLVIVPRIGRDQLGNECMAGLAQFIKHNDITDSVEIFFDEGILAKNQKSFNEEGNETFQNCKFHGNQDSKVTKGIQIADLVAHSASIMLKADMGLIKKIVKTGENSVLFNILNMFKVV